MFTVHEINKESFAELYQKIQSNQVLFNDFEYLLNRINDNSEFGDMLQRSNKSTYYSLNSGSDSMALIEFVYTPNKVKILDIHVFDTQNQNTAHTSVLVKMVDMCLSQFKVVKLYIRESAIFFALKQSGGLNQLNSAFVQENLPLTAGFAGRFIEINKL